MNALASRDGMLNIDPVILNLAVALGIGLLIGAERERRKGEGPSRSPAGIRTFAVTSLAGAISFTVGGDLVLAVTMAGVIALTAVAYWRAHEDDPGLTSESRADPDCSARRVVHATTRIGGAHRCRRGRPARRSNSAPSFRPLGAHGA